MPKKFLLTSPPLTGHTNQLIVLAAELTRLGHSVTFATDRSFEGRVRAAGAKFISFGASEIIDSADPYLSTYNSLWHDISFDASIVRSRKRLLELFIHTYAVMHAEFLSIAKRTQPDTILVDSVALAGLDVARQLKIPLVALAMFLTESVPDNFRFPNIDLDFPAKMTGSQKIINLLYPWQKLVRILPELLRLQRLRSRCAKDNGFIVPSDKYPILVATSFGLELTRELPPNVQLVGPILSTATQELSPELRSWLDNSADTPVIFVSFGTLAELSKSSATSILEGLKSCPVRVLWSLRTDQQGLLADIPTSVRIESTVPQQAVLAHPAVKVFLSHCGMNSVSESIYYGKPILGVPIFIDQHYNSARVVDAGIGVRIAKSEVSATSVRNSVNLLLSEERFVQAVRRLSKVVTGNDSLGRTIGLIECASELQANC